MLRDKKFKNGGKNGESGRCTDGVYGGNKGYIREVMTVEEYIEGEM
ncbi:hypothetical protein TRIP_E120034 [uncultured Spirochaetota bacterium]|nr:hypothetical protein TRIP_E120034 [uncultured Spirochaetota bacterium]